MSDATALALLDAIEADILDAIAALEASLLAELEAELLIQGWPQAEVDALGVEVDDDKWPGVGFPKLDQMVADWRTALDLPI